MLIIVSTCNLVQYQGKLIMGPWENGKNLDFGPNLESQKLMILTRFAPNLVPKIFFVGFTSTRSYTLLQAIIVCNFKEN